MENEERTKKVSIGKKLIYGVGGFGENFFHNALNMMATPVMNMGHGVSPALISVAMTIPRIWDAITDPFMGNISDNHRSRYGRRRPFVLAGGLLTSASFAAIWWLPEGMSEMQYFWSFLGMLLVYYTAFTVFIVPYLALGFELSDDYHERTRLMSYKSFFSVMAGFAMSWMYWLTQRDCFEGIVDGMRWVGLGVGVILMIVCSLPALFLKERPLPTAKRGAGGHSTEKIGVLKSLRMVFERKPFLRVIGTCVCVIVGVLSIMQIGMYLNIYYVCAGDQDLASKIQGITGTVYQAVSIATIPVVAYLGVRFGKRKTLMGLMAMGITGSLLSLLCLTPSMPYLQIVSLIFTAPAIGGLWILAPSMIADVCDYDESITGTKREGAFGASYGWFTKLAGSGALMISGFVLVWTGFDVGLGAEQSVDTLWSMRLLNAFVPALAFGLALLCIFKYPLSEAFMEGIRRSKDTVGDGSAIESNPKADSVVSV